MKASIIIPVHNEWNYFQECLNGLQQQTIQDFEVIVVCDGCDIDYAKEIWERAGVRSVRVRFLEGGTGVAAARNQGMAVAEGEFLFFHDCDDYIEKEALELLLAESENVDVVVGTKKYTWYGASVLVESDSKLLQLNQKLQHERNTIEDISVLGMLIRRQYAEREELQFDESFLYGSDLPFVASLMGRTDRVESSPKAVYWKREHNDTINHPSLFQRTDRATRCREILRAYLAAEEQWDTPVLREKLQVFYKKVVEPFYLSPESEGKEEIFSLAVQCRMERETADLRRKGKSLRRRKRLKRLVSLMTSRTEMKFFLYRKIFLKMKVKKDWIVYESFFGKSYSDSPRYIYEYLAQHFPKEYKHVWVMKQKKKLPYGGTEVKRHSLRFLYYMARAGYFVFNGRQPLYIQKREGTVFLETWHGTPLKKLVFDMNEVTMANPLYKADVYRQSRDWDYLIAPNQFSADIFARCFMFENTMLHTGYPRNDILHSGQGAERIEEIKSELGIPRNKKVILYAPTWRDNEFHKSGGWKFSLKLDLEKMQQALDEEYVILLRTHYFVVDGLDLAPFRGFAYDVSKYDDIARLYLISDILITDYSSVFFDYANLKRPMLFFAYDIEKYRDVLRGFYIDMEKELPGPIVHTTEEVITKVQNLSDVIGQYQEKYNVFYEKYCNWEDGDSTERVVQAVFKRKA